MKNGIDKEIEDTKKGINVLGILVERKTDILAFTAFLISIGSLILQTVNLIKGPDVRLEPPKQVLLVSEKYPDKKNYLRISAKLIYLNQGSPGYDDITKSEQAFFMLGGKRIELTGQEYVESGFVDNRFKVKKISDADPVQIKSGGVVVHETYFVPWPSKTGAPSSNFIEFSEFLKELRQQPELRITFIAKTFSGTLNKATCKLSTKEFIHHLETKHWSAPTCK
ncbi:MAG: hypothetical protein HUN04_12580 [Desulfobacter sp.]|nr:MAG: hypothetical protein HUN04_12580 [Desulfobacter sp.]